MAEFGEVPQQSLLGVVERTHLSPPTVRIRCVPGRVNGQHPLADHTLCGVRARRASAVPLAFGQITIRCVHPAHAAGQISIST